MGSNPTPPKLNSNIKFENIVGRCKNLSAFSLQANRELADRKNLDYLGVKTWKYEVNTVIKLAVVGMRNRSPHIPNTHLAQSHANLVTVFI